MDALTCVDTDTMAEMLGDVVVVGGSAALEGLGDRLEEELKAMLPEALANRVEVRVPSRADLQHRLVRAPRLLLKPVLEKQHALRRGSGSRDLIFKHKMAPL